MGEKIKESKSPVGSIFVELGFLRHQELERL